MPPLSAFGVWWSRYYAYSQEQFETEVLQGYANHSLPLSHVVLDMDW
jgi:alpha-glucosidase (family GH31 glycosyl hydrolase)